MNKGKVLYKTGAEIAKYLKISKSTMSVILSRADFFKYYQGGVYCIDRDFAMSLYNYLELKRRTSIDARQRYGMAQRQLYQWLKRLS